MTETHEGTKVPVANGAARIKCSCGWQSTVRDDGYMFDPGHPLNLDIDRQFQEHASTAPRKRPSSSMSFSQALVALEAGKSVQRASWEQWQRLRMQGPDIQEFYGGSWSLWQPHQVAILANDWRVVS